MMRDRLQRVHNALRDASWRQAVRLIGQAGLVGLVAGFAAIGFHALSQSLFELCMTEIAGYLPRAAGVPAPTSMDASTLRPWFLLGLPAVGGLFSGWLVTRFAPEAAGHGIDAVLAAYHQRGGVIAARVPIIKALASILTLGSGGSGGREGPISQIGAGFGSLVARWLKLSARDRRVLLAAGMGAGVGAIFRAPLAGALFASEIHYREAEFESEAIIPSAMASIVSYCVYSLAYGWEPLFHTGVTTSLTIGSGGSAGVFGPSMVIGGAVGGAVGHTLHQLFPGVVVEPAAYVLVGMAGFFAGAANTPVSTLIMVSEMSGNYHLLLPALWVTTLSYLLLRRVSLYEPAAPTKAISRSSARTTNWRVSCRSMISASSCATTRCGAWRLRQTSPPPTSRGCAWGMRSAP